MPKKLTTQNFITKAKEIHKNKYDYSKTKYINNRTKIIIICNKHGEFLQTPANHLAGQNCKKCGHNMLTKQEFIDKAQKIHKNKYDYSNINYIDIKTKITIICPTHNKFLQLPESHLLGNNCPKCAGITKSTTTEFIKKAKNIYKNKYEYSKVDYVNSHTKVTIICKKHGEFLQTPNQHLNGHNCPNCITINHKSTKKQFIRKAQIVHDNKYDYSNTKYKNAHSKIVIICLVHGQFLQTPHNHLSKNGCPKCSHIISKPETNWLNKLEQEQNIKIKRNSTIRIHGKLFKPDGFYKETNTWYEYNGYYFHGHPNKYNPQDINKVNGKTFDELYQNTLDKEKIIKSAGYNLITKWGN